MSVVIRSPMVADVVALTDIYNHYICNTTITFDLEPYSVEERQALWFDHYANQGRHRLWVAEVDQAIIGYATSSPFHRKAAYDTSVETSIYLAPEFVGQGIGRSLYQKLFESLQGEDIHRAYALITQPNLASEKFHQAFGFKQVGHCKEVGRKFGQYWDVKWYEKSISE